MTDEVQPDPARDRIDLQRVGEAPPGPETYGRSNKAWVPVTREAPTDNKQYARQNEGWSEVAAAAGVDYGKGLAVDKTQTPPIVNLTPAGWDAKFLGGTFGSARSATQGLDLSAAGTGEISAPLATDLLAGSIVEPPPDDKEYARKRTVAGVSFWVPSTSLYQGIWNVTTNTPPLHTIPRKAGWMWVASTLVPTVPEAPPVSIPGLTGLAIYEGDHIVCQDGNAYIIIKGVLQPNYRGLWNVASNTPPIATPPIGNNKPNWMWVAKTVDPAVPETGPAGVPGITGKSVHEGDHIVWDDANSTFILVSGNSAPAAGLQITGLIPDKVMIPSTASVTVHAYGSDFTNTCQILLDGVATATTFVSATELTYIVDPTGVTTAKTVVVTVRNNTGPVTGAGAEAFEYVVTSTAVDYGNGLALDETATPPIVHLTPAGLEARFIGGVWAPPRSATQALTIDVGSSSAPATGQAVVPLATDLLAGSIVEPPPSDTVTYARKRTVAGVSSWVLASGTVWTSDTPPPNPVEDTLWWHTTTGELHIYYNDGNTSQWVEIGGDAPIAGVYTDDAPPANPVEDQLWWETDTGKLYVYYNDGNSKQWVEVTSAAGPPGPATITVSDIAPTTPTLNQVWWNSLDSNTYLWYDDGNTKQWVQTNGDSKVAGVTIGDVKSGFQPADHGGWIKLNGRATTALTPTQKAAAASIGFATNIPEGSNVTLMQTGSPLGNRVGNMNKTITQANIPAMTSSSGGSATTSSGPALDTAVRGTVRGRSATGGTGYYFLDAEGGNVRSIAHTHTVPAHTHTVGGSGAPFDITPASLSVNHFVFLGW